jgi:hypothetical protein
MMALTVAAGCSSISQWPHMGRRRRYLRGAGHELVGRRLRESWLRLPPVIFRRTEQNGSTSALAHTHIRIGEVGG